MNASQVIQSAIQEEPSQPNSTVSQEKSNETAIEPGPDVPSTHDEVEGKEEERKSDLPTNNKKDKPLDLTVAVVECVHDEFNGELSSEGKTLRTQ